MAMWFEGKRALFHTRVLQLLREAAIENALHLRRRRAPALYRVAAATTPA
jgi:hypothetical protein